MKTNVGTLDRILRVLIGLGLGSLFFLLEGPIHFVGLIGIVPLGTAVLGSCPLYALLGLSTCPLDKQ
ncbi:MAG: DUF2892 domain-containing protein [Acidobacteriota bacterium]|nr:DUF2892 domain-containing protein [Acidobacteriota bacterium]